MNPYRRTFYSRQADWHGYLGAHDIATRHQARARYFSWYTQGWLPSSPDASILDIACGAGQFLYFLHSRGFTNCTGIDVDEVQIRYAQELGLCCACADAGSFLATNANKYEVISLFDILEHFTREELFELLEAVVGHLTPTGSIILSVPNAESPAGLATCFADITHELGFTRTSLSQMLLCHGLELTDVRDPWPAPVSPLRAFHRKVAILARRLSAIRYLLLGLPSPRYWSPVIYGCAHRNVASIHHEGR